MITNSTSRFTVTGFKLNQENISISISRKGEDENISISRSEFEKWVEKLGKLELPMQYYDSDEVAEVAKSTMTWAEYYEEGNIYSDLHDYIIIQDGDKIFTDIREDIMSICNK